MLLASRSSNCFRNRSFRFWNIISTVFYCSKWKSHDSIFDFHTAMHIDGSSNAKTECLYKIEVLYFRFIVTLLTKQKWISQKKKQKKKRAILKYKTFGLWFFWKFSEILNKLTSCIFKAIGFYKVLQQFWKDLQRSIPNSEMCHSGSYSWRCVVCLWSVSFWENMKIRIACFF